MSPAAPAPCVFTEIFAPSLITRDGAVTAIRPAFPVLSAVLKTPLAAPARDTAPPGRRLAVRGVAVAGPPVPDPQDLTGCQDDVARRAGALRAHRDLRAVA